MARCHTRNLHFIDLWVSKAEKSIEKKTFTSPQFRYHGTRISEIFFCFHTFGSLLRSYMQIYSYNLYTIYIYIYKPYIVYIYIHGCLRYYARFMWFLFPTSSDQPLQRKHHYPQTCGSQRGSHCCCGPVCNWMVVSNMLFSPLLGEMIQFD